ncbi:rfaE bifunctional protein, domain I [Chitinasiproducens palmae]|uniref:RfaE bifunctional protein, domain I n=2 Tax=Chitinasiproducens palmae TaxID=1770053 RepID=A0A1H2PNS1_9BURK|nr:D-glycero-beta-D-manno-heptose-7-phosphate kinase [Chitinasiproducens palmae]SDV47832.1 rfaE bifunctional protein, domain I [Chitinasiproducens palmae]
MPGPMSVAPVARERLAAARVLVVGDVILDRYWFGTVDRISPEAPVPVLHAQRVEERLGGAANVAANVAGLCAHASLLCVVGTDEAGERLLALLSASRVEAHPHRDPSIATIVKLRVMARHQHLLRIDFEEPPAKEILRAALGQFEALIDTHQVLLLSDYAKGGLAHVEQMIAGARARGRPVMVDPKGVDWRRYRGATLITPNRKELRDVIGGWSSEAALHARVDTLRRDLSIGALLLTRSEEGMTLFDDRGTVHVPTEARDVFDVSGAGDTVIATMAAMVGAGVPLLEAVVHANRAAGVVVGKLGTVPVGYDELVAAHRVQA